MIRIWRLALPLLLALAPFPAAAEDDPYAPYRSAMRGDSVIFAITARCDSARLRQIEAGLGKGQKTVVWYSYTMLFHFREGKFAGAAIEGMDLPPAVRQCIIGSFMSTARFPAPADGTVPFEVAFPVFVGAKP
jgi:hypothetical protein